MTTAKIAVASNATANRSVDCPEVHSAAVFVVSYARLLVPPEKASTVASNSSRPRLWPKPNHPPVSTTRQSFLCPHQPGWSKVSSSQLACTTSHPLSPCHVLLKAAIYRILPSRVALRHKIAVGLTRRPLGCARRCTGMVDRHVHVLDDSPSRDSGQWHWRYE